MECGLAGWSVDFWGGVWACGVECGLVGGANGTGFNMRVGLAGRSM